jgi:FAD/FMN-containing dehydrogenases
MIQSVLFNDLKPRFKGELLEDELYRAIYATDASVYQMSPMGVAFPTNESDLQEIVKWANTNEIALIPRAAGTSLAGQCVGEGVVVDTSKYLNKILDFDEKGRKIRVQPGVIRDELNAYLKPYGLFLALIRLQLIGVQWAEWWVIIVQEPPLFVTELLATRCLF